VDDIPDYLTTSDLARGAIAKMSDEISIPESAIRDWRASRVAGEN
jgi:hypothetical protein